MNHESYVNDWPEPLKKGYHAFIDWRDARDRAGDPLPPGGVFLLQRESIMQDEIGLLYSRIVADLEIPPKCVEIKMISQPSGRLIPEINVDPPKSWLKKFEPPQPVAGDNIRAIAQTFIKSVLTMRFNQMRKAYDHRCAGLDYRRVQYDPAEVIDCAQNPQRQA